MKKELLNRRVFAHVGTNEIDTTREYVKLNLEKRYPNKFERKIKKIERDRINKPNSGLWATAYFGPSFWEMEPDAEYKYVCRWEHHCKAEFGNVSLKNIKLKKEFDFDKYALFRVREDANILIINSLEDLYNLGDTYIDREFVSEKKELLDIIKSSDSDSLEVIKAGCLYSKYGEQMSVLKLDEIIRDYDGIYMSDEAISQCYPIFNEWDVESIVIFNLDKIELVDK